MKLDLTITDILLELLAKCVCERERERGNDIEGEGEALVSHKMHFEYFVICRFNVPYGLQHFSLSLSLFVHKKFGRQFIVLIYIFEMEAIPFPCNCLNFVWVN